MVQSKSLIVAVATAATVLYAANPALGATIHFRRDDEMNLVTRANTHKHHKGMVDGHSAPWWNRLYKEERQSFLQVLKVFKLYISNGSQADKTKILQQLAAAGTKRKGDKEDKEDGKKDKKDEKKDKSFKKKKDDKKDKKSEKKARDLEDDDLFARDFENDDLFTREFDEDELLARDFDSDDLVTRDLDDELVSRDIFDGLSEVEARDLLDALNELEARDFDEQLLERSDVYDDLD